MGKSRYRLEYWDDIRFLLAVAKTGSYAAAAKELFTNTSTISRRMHRLEHFLGAKLFDRHARGMRPTPTGMALIEHAKPMETTVNRIETYLAGSDQEIPGKISISATDGIATNWLTPTLADFQQQYPEVQIELVICFRPVDLRNREADIAIRLFEPMDTNIEAEKVGVMHVSLFASQKYVNRYGVPKSLDDLKNHRIVNSDGYDVTTELRWWSQLISNHKHVSFQANSSSAFLTAIKEGYGVGMLPTFYRYVAPDLVRFPMDLNCYVSIWLASHKETNKNVRTRLVLDFFRKRFAQDRADWFS